MKLSFRHVLTLSILCAFLLASGCGKDAPSNNEPAVAAAAATAHAHVEAGATCAVCDASKRDPKRLWCKEHARYEDRCWLCHPELRDEKRAYCEEHHAYKDECPEGDHP